MITCFVSGKPLGPGHRVFIAEFPPHARRKRPLALSEEAVSALPFTSKGDIKNNEEILGIPRVVEVHEAQLADDGRAIMKATKSKTFVFSLPLQKAEEILTSLKSQLAA